MSEETDSDLMWVIFESMIRLMEEARLKGDTKKLNTYARLVHEGWVALINEEEEK